MLKPGTHATTNATSTVRSADGTTISYLSLGSGPAVIVIPGALSLASDYAAFARALAENFTVYTIERRGRGLSGPQGNDYSIRKECEDVQALRRKTGASLLVGHSFGGLVALEVARHSNAFTSIAVYEPGVSIDGSIPAEWIPVYEKMLAEGKKMDAFIEFIKAFNPQDSGKTPSWLLKLMLPLFMGSHRLQLKLSLLPQNLREHKEVVRLDNSYVNYREISAKVLLMYGGKGPTSQGMQQLAAVFPQSTSKVFPALGHFGLNEGNPQEVASAVSAYFKQ